MRRRIIAVILPVVAIIGFVILKTYSDFFVGLLPAHCGYYLLTGKQCIACGNTRSVLSILNGDIISAIKFNPTIPLLCASALLWYVEFAANSFLEKKIKIFPRKIIFWAVLIIALAIYLVVRNYI